jgi:hypothetical protein
VDWAEVGLRRHESVVGIGAERVELDDRFVSIGLDTGEVVGDTDVEPVRVANGKEGSEGSGEKRGRDELARHHLPLLAWRVNLDIDGRRRRVDIGSSEGEGTDATAWAVERHDDEVSLLDGGEVERREGCLD